MPWFGSAAATTNVRVVHLGKHIAAHAPASWTGLHTLGTRVTMRFGDPHSAAAPCEAVPQCGDAERLLKAGLAAG